METFFKCDRGEESVASYNKSSGSFLRITSKNNIDIYFMYKQFTSKTAIKDNLPTLPFQQKMETYANLSSFPHHLDETSSKLSTENSRHRSHRSSSKKEKEKKKRRNSFDPIPRKRTTKFSPSVFFFPP